MNHIPVTKLSKDIWGLFRKNLKFFSIFGITIAILGILKSFFDTRWSVLNGGETLPEIASTLITIILFVASIYLIVTSLQAVRNEKIILHVPLLRLLNVIGAHILFLVLGVLALVLSFAIPAVLIFVGIVVLGANNLGTVLVGIAAALGIVVFLGWVYISVRISFWNWILVDRGNSIFKNIKQSWVLTKHSFWYLTLIALLLGVLNAIGAVVWYVGTAVTVPLSFLAVALIYRHLNQNLSENPQESETATRVSASDQ